MPEVEIIVMKSGPTSLKHEGADEHCRGAVPDAEESSGMARLPSVRCWRLRWRTPVDAPVPYFSGALRSFACEYESRDAALPHSGENTDEGADERRPEQADHLPHKVREPETANLRERSASMVVLTSPPPADLHEGEEADEHGSS